jgi:CBS domain-containing protein
LLTRIAATPIRRLSPNSPSCVLASDPLQHAVDAMMEHHCGAVLVCDDKGVLIGILTERDLLLRSADYTDTWLTRPVSEFMTANPASAEMSCTVSDVVALMREGGYRHVPITDAEGRATGIVSVRDVLSFVAEHFPEEVLNLPPKPSLEAKSRWGG